MRPSLMTAMLAAGVLSARIRSARGAPWSARPAMTTGGVSPFSTRRMRAASEASCASAGVAPSTAARKKAMVFRMRVR
jgi:hypothetical protein